ncbi:MAG: OmpA family protein, partial [Bacteroidota bacterium]
LILGGYEEPEPIVIDADKDGGPDEKDQCPNEPGTAALQGCPDTDGDGVVDKFDDCPTEAGLAEMRGCPDKDKDDDGIADDQDRCPDQPGTAATAGCPDRDGDGIADKNDLCPDAAGSHEYMGCPDTDGDGVVDVHDLCPTTPGPESNKGCPELKPEEKQVLEFAMKAVQFETGSAKLLLESHKILDEIAALLKKYADHKMRISGHTDSIGEAALNQKLSEERAKTCYFYLANKGIATERMSYKGFGESQPIGDNRYAAGRDKNRRVEFEMYVKSE